MTAENFDETTSVTLAALRLGLPTFRVSQMCQQGVIVNARKDDRGWWRVPHSEVQRLVEYVLTGSRPYASGIVTVKEAAQMLNVCPQTICYRIRTGALSATKAFHDGKVHYEIERREVMQLLSRLDASVLIERPGQRRRGHPGCKVQLRKRCRDCQKVKDIDDFHKNNQLPNGEPRCKECRNAAHRAYMASNPEKARAKRYRDNLRKALGDENGETLYARLHEAQSGLCAICGAAAQTGARLNIDHDHLTGAIRGLLCRSCNWGLGHFRDNVETMAAAIDYLRQRLELAS